MSTRAIRGVSIAQPLQRVCSNHHRRQPCHICLLSITSLTNHKIVAHVLEADSKSFQPPVPASAPVPPVPPVPTVFPANDHWATQQQIQYKLPSSSISHHPFINLPLCSFVTSARKRTRMSFGITQVPLFIFIFNLITTTSISRFVNLSENFKNAPI